MEYKLSIIATMAERMYLPIQEEIQKIANMLFVQAHESGLSYAPYTDASGSETLDGAVEAAIEDDWEVNSFVFMGADGTGKEEVDLCVNCRNQLARFFRGDYSMTNDCRSKA